MFQNKITLTKIIFYAPFFQCTEVGRVLSAVFHEANGESVSLAGYLGQKDEYTCISRAAVRLVSSAFPRNPGCSSHVCPNVNSSCIWGRQPSDVNTSIDPRPSPLLPETPCRDTMPHFDASSASKWKQHLLVVGRFPRTLKLC
jgi:hypothetical protein